MSEVLLVVLGFTLTTVAGGWWATRLQDRSWDRQNEVRLRELEQQAAGRVCQELATLMDRRLYRMQLLLWEAAPAPGGVVDPEGLELRRAAYRDVLLAWNDGLNTNLSLVRTYFGADAFVALEHVYEQFRRVGGRIEAAVRTATAGGDAWSVREEVSPQFEGHPAGTLNDRVYRLTSLMTGRLRDGAVGRHAPGWVAAEQTGLA